MLAAVLLSSSSPLTWGAPEPASPTPTCPDSCWSLIGQPTYTLFANSYAAAVTYRNNFNSSVQGSVYLVMRNQIGQTVGLDLTSTTVPPGGNATLHPSIGGLLPPGNYSTYIFAINSPGVAISGATTGSLESTYVLRVALFGAESGAGPVNVTVGLENVSPSPVVANVTIIASENQSPVARNQTEVTIPVSSTVDVPFVLIGTANLSSCLDFYIFMQNANGMNLAPPDHESTC
jgi:hypothetical protein